MPNLLRGSLTRLSRILRGSLTRLSGILRSFLPRGSMFLRLAGVFLLLLVLSMWLTAERSARLTAVWYTAQMQEDLLSRAKLAGELADRLAAAGAPLQPAIVRAGRNAGVRLTIIAHDGRVLADSEEDPALMPNHAERPEVKAALQGQVGKAVRFSDTLQRHMAYVAVPWRPPVLPQGARQLPLVVRVAVRQSDLAQSQAAVRHAVFLDNLWVTLIAAFLTLLVARHLSRPLQRMTDLARQMAEGDFTGRLPQLAGDEVGQLARAFNRMADQLHIRMEQLDRRRQELATIQASMGEGVLAVDIRGVILHINPAAERLFGLNPGEAHRRPLLEAIRHPELVKAMEKALYGERQAVELELHHPAPRTLEAVFIPVSADVNDPAAIRAVAVLRDITELRHLERVRRDFVSNAAHELRTPLTAIKGFAETLRETEDPAERAAYLNIIDEETERLGNVVADLLLLARLENTNQPMPMVPVDPAKLVAQAVNLLQNKVKEKNLQLTLSAGELRPINGNETILEQVLINLLDNAVKYTPAGGAITIDYGKRDESFRFAVTDTGPGIDPRHQARIFERFYRVDPGRSRAVGGTGLGLSIVKHIVERHGGRVGVESAPGRGTSFWCEFPLPDLRR